MKKPAPFDNSDSLERLTLKVHNLSVRKGWWDDKNEAELVAERELAVIALLHIGLSSRLEAVRTGRKCEAYNPTQAEQAARDVVASLDRNQVSMLAKLALIHSEVSEAVECVVDRAYDETEGKNGKPEGLGAEIVDIIIRSLDFCGGFGINVVRSLFRKHAFNETRPHKHGGKLA